MLPSLRLFVFGGKAWTGPGDGRAICESTGRGYAFSGETKRDSAKEGGRPAAPPGPRERPPPWLREAQRRPRARRRLRRTCPPFFFWKANQGGKV